jgi:hypothetical protein
MNRCDTLKAVLAQTAVVSAGRIPLASAPKLGKKR